LCLVWATLETGSLAPAEPAFVFLLAFGVAALVTPAARWLSFRWGIVAAPGGRRRHVGYIPKLGGLPLFAAFIAGAALAWVLIPPEGDDARRLQGVLWGSLIMVVGGLIDDRWELTAVPQFLIQFAGAGVAMAHLIFIELFTNPLSGEIEKLPFWFALVITLLWVVGMINAVNWLDGLDGLAAGVGGIAALLFAWHSYVLGQTTVALFPLALAGGLAGFLLFNFHPARIFLGTAGAYFLAYNLATLAILSPAKIATALLVLAVPIVDGVWLVIDRLRQGHSPMHGDRGHLHFRLADQGWPVRGIVMGYYAVALLFGLAAIFATGLTKLILLTVWGVAVLGLLVRLSWREEGRRKK
jgi:UDP-GlcNAc:undecaprenyl-phosphate/decaprenyl-phosphate GlcNAc-1-phosphate transferase